MRLLGLAAVATGARLDAQQIDLRRLGKQEKELKEAIQELRFWCAEVEQLVRERDA